MSGGHLCEAEAPTEAAAETVDFAKQKTEGEIAKSLTTPQSCLRQASSPDKWSYLSIQVYIGIKSPPQIKICECQPEQREGS